MDTIQSINLITINPNIRRGRPCIAGTGLRVTDIVIATIFHDRTPGQIASDYGVSLAQVHAALAYYYQNQDELDTDIRQQIETARKLKDNASGNRKTSLLS